MAADGTPEPAIRRCGAAIARLRTIRGWSHAKLIARLYDQIDPTDPIYDRISVAWLARLEQGRVVKLSRMMLDALCRALECTPRERIELLLLVDRNPIGCADRAPTPAALAIAYTAAQLYGEAHATVSELIGSRSLDAIGDLSLLEIVAASLQELSHGSYELYSSWGCGGAPAESSFSGSLRAAALSEPEKEMSLGGLAPSEPPKL